MADGHVAHEKGEADPWHVWSLDVCSNEICADGIERDDGQTSPEVEEANEEENSDSACSRSI
jgi:hypothetical protein